MKFFHIADTHLGAIPDAGFAWSEERRSEIWESFRSVVAKADREEERAILISSHISGDLENLCDDLYLIDQGKIRLHEDTDVLLDQYGILKVTESEFAALDKQYILAYCKEDFGYRCLTDQKQYYMENMPQIVIEKGTIDEVMKTMLKGSSRKGVSL